VFVIFFMARETVRFQLILVQIAFVAADTLHFTVLAEQRILGLPVMVEHDLFPALRIMAGFALGTEASLVLVILFVAGVTIGLQLILV
jgi:hypothetical protein